MPGVCNSTYLDNSAYAASAAVEAMDFAASLGGAIVRRCKEEVWSFSGNKEQFGLCFVLRQQGRI
jgi:hypothetical protein